MNISGEVINILRQGRIIGAELNSPRLDFRAFVLVIPQVSEQGGNLLMKNEGGLIGLDDSSLISGYEIRYLEHHAKYTDVEWGMDYDYVLDDITTRVKRIFVTQEDEIAAALAQWFKNLPVFTTPDDFDSSLANSLIDSYLNRPNERPHLWR